MSSGGKKKQKKTFSYAFTFSHHVFFFFPLMVTEVSRPPSLTDVLWHELSSADTGTAEGFDSVHSKYPAPSRPDQNRRLSRHRQARSASLCHHCQKVGAAAGCSLYNTAMACNILLNSKICQRLMRRSG